MLNPKATPACARSWRQLPAFFRILNLNVSSLPLAAASIVPCSHIPAPRPLAKSRFLTSLQPASVFPSSLGPPYFQVRDEYLVVRNLPPPAPASAARDQGAATTGEDSAMPGAIGSGPSLAAIVEQAALMPPEPQRAATGQQASTSAARATASGAAAGPAAPPGLALAVVPAGG